MYHGVFARGTMVPLAVYDVDCEQDARVQWARRSDFYDIVVERLQAPRALMLSRKVRGLSLQKVADALGVTTPAVLHWERGDRDPSPEHARALYDLLGVKMISGTGKGRRLPIILFCVPQVLETRLDAMAEDVEIDWLDRVWASLINRLDYTADASRPFFGLTCEERVCLLDGHPCVIEHCPGIYRVVISASRDDFAKLLIALNTTH